MRLYSSSLPPPLLALALADESPAYIRVHMAVQVLTQSSAHGLTSRSPLQCESSSHCISVATGKKLNAETVTKRKRGGVVRRAHLQHRQGDNPSGPIKSAAVATRGGGGGGGGGGGVAGVDDEFVAFEEGGAVVAGGAAVVVGRAAVVEGADVAAAGAAAARRREEKRQLLRQLGEEW
jgi:hypothetical protein